MSTKGSGARKGTKNDVFKAGQPKEQKEKKHLNKQALLIGIVVLILLLLFDYFIAKNPITG